MRSSSWSVRCAVACAALMACVGMLRAQQTQPADISDRIALWAQRPPIGATVMDTYTTALTITSQFPSTFKAAVRQVIEMKVSHMVLGLGDQLTPEPDRDATVEDLRRLWRLDILGDLAKGTPQFKAEALAVLCPILADVAVGMLDEKGDPAVAARVNALLLLTDIAGSDGSKVNALLSILRRKGVERGALLMVVRELGRLKIGVTAPDILKLLSDDNPVLLAAGARALGKIADMGALDPLIALLLRAGDSVKATPEDARDAVLAVIEGLRGVASANALNERQQAKTVAALMRTVLSDPDRLVVVAAADAVRQISGYPMALDARMSEEDFQAGIEKMRDWWLKQKLAPEYYRGFFSGETEK